MSNSEFEELCINTIRFLAVDMVQQATWGPMVILIAHLNPAEQQAQPTMSPL